jgi:hypothetical protein
MIVSHIYFYPCPILVIWTQKTHILINWHVYFVGAKSSQLVWCDLERALACSLVVLFTSVKKCNIGAYLSFWWYFVLYFILFSSPARYYWNIVEWFLNIFRFVKFSFWFIGWIRRCCKFIAIIGKLLLCKCNRSSLFWNLW